MKVIPKGTMTSISAITFALYLVVTNTFRWKKYHAMGERIAGTKMIPFKTPLSEDICNPWLPDDNWFTPAILLQKQPGLKTVVDLTDTCRYYDPEEFMREGVDHVKIRITGGGRLPSPHKLRQFFKTMDEFMEMYADDPDALIGVHCTHGLNRTGYFICHYMVDRLDMSPDEAISKFESARGHVMHRANFISEIRKLREALSRNQQERSTGNSKTVGYSSPLNDSLYTEEQPKGRGHPKNRPGKTIVENWRKRDGDSGVSNLQNFQHNQSRSNSHRYDSKSKYGREKQFPKGEKHTRKASSHPYSGETLRSSLTGNWRDRP